MSAERERSTFSQGWYGYSNAEIEVARQAILHASGIGPEDYYKQTEQGKADVSPVVDRTLLIAVLADLVSDLSRRLTLAEKRIEWMKHQMERLTHDDTPQPDPADD
jgi:hypothetical protein